MTGPNPEVDELCEILNELEDIALLAETCHGRDDTSNRAFVAIEKKTRRVIQIVRALSETNLFSPEEIMERLRNSQENKNERVAQELERFPDKEEAGSANLSSPITTTRIQGRT